nr:uncharacterized protein LOC104115704 [Nicotiana tomentosiformis]
MIQREEKIAKAAVRHFQKMINLLPVNVDGNILNCIREVITQEDNLQLSQVPEESEIKELVFDMSATSYLRRISLSNFSSKIILKVLVGRLNPLLPRLISKHQSGLLKGRLIADNVFLAQEIVQGISQPNTGGSIMIKLDMAKAYDRLSWDILISVLRNFGFSEWWMEAVRRLISDVWYSIIVNGARKGFFTSSQGLKGDPLSPSLFIMGVEVKLYEKSSGQKVNEDKSFLCTSPKASSSRINKMIDSTGFKPKQFPFTYLGSPLYVGRKKLSIFDDLVNKIIKKIHGWQGKFLSYGGKITLIKHVLQAVSTYTFAEMYPPKGTFKLIEKHFAKFF